MFLLRVPSHYYSSEEIEEMKIKNKNKNKIVPRDPRPEDCPDDEVPQPNSWTRNVLANDNLMTALKVLAAVILLTLLYFIFIHGSLHYCICLPDIWYGIKDCADLIIAKILKHLSGLISGGGLCFTPYLQEILFDMEMCVLFMFNYMFAIFRVAHFLVEKIRLLIATT